MAPSKKTDLDITPNTRLLIEVENRTMNLVVEDKVIPVGTQRLEILGKELAIFQRYVEDDTAEWDSCQKLYAKKLKEIDTKKDGEGHDLPKEAKDVARDILRKKFSPNAEFFKRTGRSIRPFVSLKVVENLGEPVTDKSLAEKLMEELMKRQS